MTQLPEKFEDYWNDDNNYARKLNDLIDYLKEREETQPEKPKRWRSSVVRGT